MKLQATACNWNIFIWKTTEHKHFVNKRTCAKWFKQNTFIEMIGNFGLFIPTTTHQRISRFGFYVHVVKTGAAKHINVSFQANDLRTLYCPSNMAGKMLTSKLLTSTWLIALRCLFELKLALPPHTSMFVSWLQYLVALWALDMFW